MLNKKIKTLVVLLVLDIFAIISMYSIGAYKDLYEQCTGIAGASSPCVEEYFYGYLLIAYIIALALAAILLINFTAIRPSEKKSRRRK